MNKSSKHSGLKPHVPVVIRPFIVSDASDLLEAVCESIESLCQWMTWCDANYTDKHAQDFIARSITDWQTGRNYSFAILDSNDQSFLGSVGLNQISRTHNFANIGYWIRKGSARKGAASTAVRLAAAFGIEKLHFQRLEIVVPTDNLASNRVAQKAGANLDGILRNRLILGGKVHDAAMYSFCLHSFHQSEANTNTSPIS